MGSVGKSEAKVMWLGLTLLRSKCRDSLAIIVCPTMKKAFLPLFVLSTVLSLSWFGKVQGFSAKKKSGFKKNQASSVKGFGAKPPTFEEVVAGFKTRLGPHANIENCPCGSGLTYADCCYPYHAGKKAPEEPQAVLKTRYSAFYFRLIPYIIATTHPECRDFSTDKTKWAKDLNKNGMFDSFDFVSLAPGACTPGTHENEAFLEFQVTLRARDGSGDTTIILEKSRFLKENNSWLYAGGQVRSQMAGLEDAVLNQ